MSLGREGVMFKRTYANVPVCCPARAILLTGTYPHVNGMMANDLRLRESEITIAEIFRERGLSHRLRREVASRWWNSHARFRSAGTAPAGF